jgi:hypothetical protein
VRARGLSRSLSSPLLYIYIYIYIYIHIYIYTYIERERESARAPKAPLCRLFCALLRRLLCRLFWLRQQSAKEACSLCCLSSQPLALNRAQPKGLKAFRPS